MHSDQIQDFALEVAERISREFNERLHAFMARAIERQKAAEFQRQYDAASIRRAA